VYNDKKLFSVLNLDDYFSKAFFSVKGVTFSMLLYCVFNVKRILYFFTFRRLIFEVVHLDYLTKKMWGLYVKNSQLFSFTFDSLYISN